MRIILTQDVSNLGSLGDEVQVKNGYARNFLLPRGLAISASEKNAKALAHKRQHLDSIREEAKSRAQSEAEKVSAIELVVKVKAGSGGKLFGSVTNRDLQELLKESGYELDRKAISLTSPVKSLGSYTASVRLHTDVRVELPFRVEAEGELVVEEPVGEAEATEGTEGTEAASDSDEQSDAPAAEATAAAVEEPAAS